jgi:hypothetical protein
MSQNLFSSEVAVVTKGRSQILYKSLAWCIFDHPHVRYCVKPTHGSLADAAPKLTVPEIDIIYRGLRLLYSFGEEAASAWRIAHCALRLGYNHL